MTERKNYFANNKNIGSCKCVGYQCWSLFLVKKLFLISVLYASVALTNGVFLIIIVSTLLPYSSNVDTFHLHFISDN